MGRSGGYWPKIRSQLKRLFVWIVVVAIVVLVGGLVYFSMPYEGTAASIDAVEEDDRVTVDRTDLGYVLQPADATPEAGVVFYPGGRVHPNAYVGSLAALSREGNVTVVVPKMPLDLAILDYGFGRTPVWDDAADRARSAHPDIDRWYVGGHSLGGSMACRYADDSDVEGLLLYASYCDVDLSDSDLDVLSVTGSADTILNRGAYDRNSANLPDSARTETLDGLNHSQFASYRGQDTPSGTGYEVAHERLNGVVVPWLRSALAGDSAALLGGIPR
ncbi:alpha/beta hydrolase [Halovenus amylolytica]|uniref:alpha/beta hydrolase n=1 Tax=Halovenus amylolytica TaxID=2500550 RepID=UPI002FC4EDB1